MAIVSVGTPVMTLGTSGTSATSAWGTGQGRSPGHFLVAVLGIASSTANANTATAPTGWFTPANGIRNNSTSSNATNYFWAFVATGGDAAPTFTLTTSGTAASAVTLFEFTDVNTATGPAGGQGGDAQGTYASGATAGTVAITATSTTNVTRPGEYALFGSTMERAAGTNTWTPSVFTNVVNNGTTNSIGHFAVDFLAPPLVGTNISPAGNWATETTAFATAQVLVLQSNQPPVSEPDGMDDLQANAIAIGQGIARASMW